jgi:thioredoxin 1
MNIVNITSPEQLTQLVNENPLTFVDFWAAWCAPCKAMNPILNKFAEDSSAQVTVAKINVDEQPELAAAFNISSIPTIMVFQDNLIPVKRVVGAVPQHVLQAVADELS